MKILVTGSAGFIGSALTLKLLARGDTVVGIDNHNDYYDPALKEARIDRFFDNLNYTHFRADLTDHQAIEEIFTNQMCRTYGLSTIFEDNKNGKFQMSKRYDVFSVLSTSD